jgi:quinol monooxygenase YgiN
MSFVQIIDCRTKNADKLAELDKEWEASVAGQHTVRRQIVTQDRNDPEHYLVFVFFDSYESAMENSNLPETAAFAEKQMPLLDGPPTFFDLDVIEERA